MLFLPFNVSPHLLHAGLADAERSVTRLPGETSPPLRGRRWSGGCARLPPPTAVGHRFPPLPGLAQQVATVSVLLTAGSCERRYAESPQLEQHLPSLPTRATGDQSAAPVSPPAS